MPQQDPCDTTRRCCRWIWVHQVQQVLHQGEGDGGSARMHNQCARHLVACRLTPPPPPERLALGQPPRPPATHLDPLPCLLHVGGRVLGSRPHRQALGGRTAACSCRAAGRAPLCQHAASALQPAHQAGAPLGRAHALPAACPRGPAAGAGVLCRRLRGECAPAAARNQVPRPPAVPTHLFERGPEARNATTGIANARPDQAGVRGCRQPGNARGWARVDALRAPPHPWPPWRVAAAGQLPRGQEGHSGGRSGRYPHSEIAREPAPGRHALAPAI